MPKIKLNTINAVSLQDIGRKNLGKEKGNS